MILCYTPEKKLQDFYTQPSLEKNSPLKTFFSSPRTALRHKGINVRTELEPAMFFYSLFIIFFLRGSSEKMIAQRGGQLKKISAPSKKINGALV